MEVVYVDRTGTKTKTETDPGRERVKQTRSSKVTLHKWTRRSDFLKTARPQPPTVPNKISSEELSALPSRVLNEPPRLLLRHGARAVAESAQGSQESTGKWREPRWLIDTASTLRFPSRTLFLAACSAGIGGTFQYGYNISVINAPTKPIQHFINETWVQRHGVPISEHHLTLLWSVIVSVFTLGGFLGASLGGTLSIRFGRKGTLLLNNAFSLLATLFMGLSYPTRMFELLIAGRFLVGLNAGIGICVQPLYLGEISPRAYRGVMAMGTSIFITGGIFTGQVIGLRELLGKEDYWPILLSTICIPAILQLIFLPWFPESPRYLLIDRGDHNKCKEALKQLYGSGGFQAEEEDMERERIELIGVKPMRPWQLFSDRSLRWQLTTIIFLCAAQQLNGINAIYFYANYVFTRAGIPEDKIPYVTIGTGACECLTALTCITSVPVQFSGLTPLPQPAALFLEPCCPSLQTALRFTVSGVSVHTKRGRLWCKNDSVYLRQGELITRNMYTGMLIDSLGRRILIIGGYSLMTLWCIIITLSLTYQEYAPWVPYISMSCIFAFILSFGLGPGGVTNILITELFTQPSRPAAYMTGGSINWLGFFLVGMIFPFIVMGLQQYCFLVFLGVCCLVATYIYFVVPETKNKTFLEIKQEFQSRYGNQKSDKTNQNRSGALLLSTDM
ncbi:GTR11 protein, partial [Polypterus senegalus]|nr:GTR11 protein [Polypterus senegalus]